jgi:Tfp pilus assembly protein PilF
MKYLRSVAAGALIGGVALACAAQRSVDDHTREDAAAARVQAAEAALEKGDYKTAESALKALLIDRPKDARVLYDLGFAQEHNGEDADAEASYRASLAADPNNALAGVGLGLLEARHGQTTEAHRELAAAASAKDAVPDVRARALRAMAALDVKSDPGQASAEVLQAIQLTGEIPSDADIAGQAALRTGSPADAEKEFARELANDPDDVNARLSLAQALKAEGKLGEAQTTLEAGVDAHPEDARLVAALAAVLSAESKDDQAIAALESLRAKDASAAQNPAITSMLARLYAMNHREADAEPLFRALLAARPDDPELADALGGVLLRQAKYAESEQVLQKAVARRNAFADASAWAEAESHLALAAQRNHHPELALQALHARDTVLPNSPASLFLEATAHDALHQYKDAERLYRAFLQSAGGKFPDEEFEARHRLIALDHAK